MRTKKEFDIRAVVRAYIEKEYGSQSSAARAWKVSPSFVSAVLSGVKPVPDYMANEAGYHLVQAAAKWVKSPKA